MQLTQDKLGSAQTQMTHLFGAGGQLSVQQMEVIAQAVLHQDAQVEDIPQEDPTPRTEPAKESPSAGMAKWALEKRWHNRHLEMTPESQWSALQAWLNFQGDRRSPQAKTLAETARRILGLPLPMKPGPKPADAPKPLRAIDAVVKAFEAKATMNADEIVDELIRLNQLPASNDPKTYVRFILSQNKTHFERDPGEGRGYYRLIRQAEPEPVPPPVPTGPEAIRPTKEEVRMLLSSARAPMNIREIFKALGVAWTVQRGKRLGDLLKKEGYIRTTKSEEVALRGMYATSYWCPLEPLPTATDEENPFADEILDHDDSILG